jgi:hypothetical protein
MAIIVVCDAETYHAGNKNSRHGKGRHTLLISRRQSSIAMATPVSGVSKAAAPPATMIAEVMGTLNSR